MKKIGYVSLLGVILSLISISIGIIICNNSIIFGILLILVGVINWFIVIYFLVKRLKKEKIEFKFEVDNTKYGEDKFMNIVILVNFFILIIVIILKIFRYI